MELENKLRAGVKSSLYNAVITAVTVALSEQVFVIYFSVYRSSH
jgi:hypothetical protein